MNRWIDEYKFFEKAQFDAFLRANNVANPAELTTTHPVWREIQRHLQQVENQWSQIANKTPAQVYLVPSQKTEQRFLRFSAEGVSLQDAEHEYTNNLHRIPWNPTAVDAHPMELVLSMRHEEEHGMQDFGIGYSSNERSLIWIERACSHTTEQYYWIRLSEMNARMKEAEWCTEMMTTHKGHTSIADRAAILQMAKSLLPKLWDIRLAQQLVPLNTAQQKAIKKKDVDIDILQCAFPGTKARDLLHQAEKFLSTEASKIYREHFSRLKAVAEQLSKDIDQWEQDLQTEQKQHKQKQENQTIADCAQQYGIPVLTEVPDGVIAVPLQSGYTAETLQNLTAKHHSPAIVLFSNKEAQLIYDIAPTPRSYSTSPSLQMQWQVANALPTMDAPETTEVEHSDDERFD